jgi:hypothetical protein
MARQVSRPVDRSARQLLPLPPPSNSRGSGSLWRTLTPVLAWRRIELRHDVRETLEQVAAEWAARERLRAAGLQVANRLAFVGEPGWGKTVTAAALGELLGLPAVKVDVAAVWSSYLGETSANVVRIVDAAAEAGGAVVLFDEFDSLAQSRSTHGDVGEMRRVTNAVLQALDQLSPDVIAVACSNMPQAWDLAVWRRFQHVLQLGPPRGTWGEWERETTRRVLVGQLLLDPESPPAALGLWMNELEKWQASPADVARLAGDANRRALTRGWDTVDGGIASAVLLHESRRREVLQRHVGGHDKDGA